MAILVTDGFEQVELTEPRKALDEAGAETKIVSPKDKEVKGWEFTDCGRTLPVDLKLDQARPVNFDALLLPGGVINPTSSGWSRNRPSSSKRYLMPASRSQRSVTTRSRSLKPALRVAAK